MGDLTPEEKWNIDEICERHGLAKEYFKDQLRHMERSYQERLTQRENHYASHEDERIAHIAALKWEKKTRSPQWFVFWEILYMLWLWFSAIIAGMYFCVGLTILYWTHTIQTIARKATTGTEYVSFTRSRREYDMLEEEGFQTFQTSVYYFILSTYILFFSITPMIYGTFKWSRSWLFQAGTHHAIAILGELWIVFRAFRYVPSACRPARFREHLFKYFQWYGILTIHKDSRGEEALDKIHTMQAALSCCGIDGYMDYYHIFATASDPGYNRTWWPKEIPTRRLLEGYDEKYYVTNGREIRQVPHSCCKPIWRHDIYCADNIFYFDNNVLNGSGVSLAKERLNPVGCVEAATELCERFRFLITWGVVTMLTARIAFYVLTVGSSPLVYKSIKWKLRWLWTLTEGRDGFPYLPAVSRRSDICTSAFRQPHDRFDPKLFRWRDADHINIEVPRQGIPVRTLVKLDDLPSEEEFLKLKQISESTRPEFTLAKLRESEKLQMKTPSVAYKELRNARRRRAEEARVEALRLQQILETPNTRVAAMTRDPGPLVDPEFTFYPVRKTIHFKEKKKYDMEVPHLIPPTDVTPEDAETLRRQQTVHVDMRFDWEAAMVEAKAEETARERQNQKNKFQRAKRRARAQGMDAVHPWLPPKRELEKIHRRLIAADEDDAPPPIWDPRDPDEGKGGFLQPMQEYEIARKKALAAGKEPPPPPVFDTRPPKALLSEAEEHVVKMLAEKIDRLTHGDAGAHGQEEVAPPGEEPIPPHEPIRGKKPRTPKKPPPSKVTLKTPGNKTAKPQSQRGLKVVGSKSTGKPVRIEVADGEETGADLTRRHPGAKRPIRKKGRSRPQSPKEKGMKVKRKASKEGQVSVKEKGSKETATPVKGQIPKVREGPKETATPVKGQIPKVREGPKETATPVKGQIPKVREGSKEITTPVKGQRRRVIRKVIAPEGEIPEEAAMPVGPTPSAASDVAVSKPPPSPFTAVLSILKKRAQEAEIAEVDDVAEADVAKLTEAEEVTEPPAPIEAEPKPDVAVAPPPVEPIPLKPTEAQIQLTSRKSRPGAKPGKSRGPRAKSWSSEAEASGDDGGRKTPEVTTRKKKLVKKKKRAKTLHVAISRSAQSLGDIRRRPRKAKGRMDISKLEQSTTTETEESGTDGSASADIQVKPRRKRKVRRKVVKVPIPIEERRAWH